MAVSVHCSPPQPFLKPIAGARPIVSHTGRVKPFYASVPRRGRQSKSGRPPTIVDSTCRADPWLFALKGKNPPGSRCGHADGCFRISAKACNRVASTGLFALAALFSNDGAMLFNFASLLLLMCELSTV